MFSVRGLFLDPPASPTVTPATFSVWLTALLGRGHRFWSHLLLQSHLSPTQPPKSDPDWPKDGNIIDLQGGDQGGQGDFWRPASGYTNGTQRATQWQAKRGPHLPWDQRQHLVGESGCKARLMGQPLCPARCRWREGQGASSLW